MADAEFAARYPQQDVDRYLAVATLMGQTLFDRDTATGAETQEVLAMKTPAVIIPGADDAHATSAARHLQEYLTDPVYHDVHPPE